MQPGLRGNLARLASRLGFGAVADGFLSAAAGSGLVKIAATMLTLAHTIALSRWLGVEGFGLYALAISVIGFLALPLSFSVATLVLREAAAAYELERWETLKGVIWFALLAVPVFAVVVTLAAIAGMALYPWPLDPVLLAALALGFLLLPLQATAEIVGAMLRAMRRVVLGLLPDQILRHALLLIFLVAAAAALGQGWLTPVTAMQLTIAATAVAAVLALTMLSAALPPAARSSRASIPWRSWLRALWPLSLLAGIQAVNMHTSVLVLGLLADPADVGVYRVAAQCSLLVAFSLLAINPAVGPYVARLHARSDPGALQRILTWTARTVLAAALPVGAALILFGSPILGFLFGSQYESGATAVTIMALGQLVNASTGAVGLALNMTGHERDTMIGHAAAAACSVALNVALIPPFGATGAAVATATSIAMWNAILVYRLHLRTGLVSFVLPLWRYRGAP